MFKTSRRSLLTALLALCTLLAQGLVLAQPSGTQAAVVTVGPQIYLTPGSITRSGGLDYLHSTYVTVTGTGFSPDSSVAITFNAAYGTDGEPLNPRTVPPAIDRPGDNRIGPNLPTTTYFPNAVVACGLTDANGNFVSAGTSTSTSVGSCADMTNTDLTGLPQPTAGAAVQLAIPDAAVDGVYEVTARDAGGHLAATQFTINREPTPDMTADPISGSSVSIEGLVKIHIRTGAFQPYSPVYFYLANFDLGVFSEPVQTPTGDTGVPLPVPACGTYSTTFEAPPYPNVCHADAQGSVTAIVQLQTDPTVTGFSPILSTEYFDQVFAIVAAGAPITSGGTAAAKHHPALTVPSGTIIYTAGIHIDHGKPGITLNSNQVGLGGAVVVSGTGFGAFAHVNLYFVPLLGTSTSPTGTTVNDLCGDPLVTNGCDPSAPYFYSPFLLGTTTADANGAFTSTFGLNLTQLGGTSGIGTITGTGVPGYILAEDFSSVYSVGAGNYSGYLLPPGYLAGGNGAVATPPSRNYTASDPFGGAPRLNEAATAAISIVQPGPSTGTATLTITPEAVTAGIAAASTTTVTAAISSTVTVTGTGFLPNESVRIIISGSGSLSTILPLGAPYPGVGASGEACPAEIVAATAANAAGVATTTFEVPETCNTTTLVNGVINGGSTVTVYAQGDQSGVTDSNTMTIPPTTATITPSPSTLNPANQGGVVSLTGNGFAANEPVTFQFGEIDPFTGLLATPVLSVSSTSDVAGSVTIAGVNLTGYLTGGLYTLIARGLASGFAANINVTYPFVFVNGNLNCPATAVLPGQPFTLTGSAFAPGTPVLVTLTPQAPSAVSITSGIPSPIFAQTIYATAGGAFSVPITVPVGTAPGSYVISVTGLIANATGGNFQEQLRECVITVGTAVPTISVSPTSASIGQSVSVTGSGFGPSEPIQVTLQYSDVTGALTGTDVPGTLQVITNTTTTGAFTATYTVASSVNALIPGSYNVTAKGQQTGAIARAPLIVTAEPQAPLNTVYFAEGYTGTVAAGAAADFVETLSILNANNYTTTYTVTYSLEGPVSGQNVASGVSSTTKVVTGTLAPNSVVERSVNTDVGLNQKVAAEVSSPSPLAVERIISRSKAGKALDSDSSLGQLLDLTSTASSFSYYFAGGAVLLTNEEYLTLLNPTSTTATVTINILPQAVISATSVPTIAPISVSVLGGARVTVPIRHDVEATGNGQLRYGMTVTSNVPLAAERVEYFGDGIGSGKYGATTKPGSSSLNRQYIFAADSGTFPSSGGNGTVGTGNDVSEVDIINPNPASAGSATVTVSFFDKSGAPINSQQVQVDGGTRETVNVNDVVGTQADVFSVVVTSDKNVYVEKPTFYGGNPENGGTFAAAEPAGSPGGLTSVAFPYLDTTGPTGAAISQTVYLYNPGATTITVRGIYVSGSGGAPVVKTYTVAANSITAVSVNADASTLPKGAIGAIFQVVFVGTNTATPNTGDSVIAVAVGNATDFSNVVGDQGTYPIGAATGF